MKNEQKKQSKAGKILWWCVFLVALGVFGFSAYQLTTTLMEYKQAESEYAELESYVEVSDTDGESQDDDSKKGTNAEEDLGPVIDFKALKEVNEDVIGWLMVEALDISYPIMQAEDNDYYLHRTTEQTYNFAGSIFLDYENKPDFSDCNSIIYGHNMKNGSMFGKLKKFREQEIYQKSLYFWICTPEKNYKYQIFAAYETAVGGETYTLFSKTGPEFMDYLTKMPTKSEIPTGKFTFDGSERVATLSTCTGNDATRFVVQGVCLNGDNGSSIGSAVQPTEEDADGTDQKTSGNH